METLEKIKASMKKIESEILENIHKYDSREQRLFDIAHKAVNIEECHHTAENTEVRKIQDYAILKANFFTRKKELKNG